LFYLNFGEIKVASLISWDFFQMIRNSQKFNSSAILLLKEQNSQEIRNFYKISSAYSLRGIKFDVAVPLEILQDTNQITSVTSHLPRRLISKLTSVSWTEILKTLSSLFGQSNLKNLKRFQILINDENTGKFHSARDNSVPSFHGG